MTSTWMNALGVAAALCSMASFTPQIAKILREHHAEAVSFRMYAITVAGFALWILYGLAIGSWPVAVSNTVNLALAGAILVLKWRFSAKGR